MKLGKQVTSQHLTLDLHVMAMNFPERFYCKHACTLMDYLEGSTVNYSP
jgi:hypothetical protein